METQVIEIADNIFRLSTEPPGAPVMFNQFVVRGDESLIFHTGMRSLFPLVSEAVAKLVPLEQLRWITFGHVEADECGAMNDFLAAAPNAAVAHGALGCMVQVNELADREPRPLADGEVIDLGGKRVRHIDTPHVPHGWDAGVMYEETTGTLLSGDLFTQLGATPATTGDSLVDSALAAEDFGQPTALTVWTAPRIHALGDLNPTTIALMHGPTFHGDGGAQLHGLADGYAAMFDAALSARV
jgi:flavorubredoxin